MRFYMLVFGVILTLSKDLLAAPCSNCTDNVTGPSLTVKPTELPTGRHYESDYTNLAWLVTPALFLIGCMYVIYKCCRDGLCNCKRLRRRAAALDAESSGVSADHGYVPLSQMALFSNTAISAPQVSSADGDVQGATTSRRLLLVHNRTYCVTVEMVPGENGAPPRRHIVVQPLKPPTYEEALAQQNLNGESGLPANPPNYEENPPCYSIAIGGEITPAPSLEDHLAIESVMTALGESNDYPVSSDFSANRRRHRSAQDALSRRPSAGTNAHKERHRNLSAQESRRPRLWSRSSTQEGAGGSEIAERGLAGSFASSLSSSLAHLHRHNFSLSALRDAFLRPGASVDSNECESLLDYDSQEDSSITPPTTVCILPATGGLPPNLADTEYSIVPTSTMPLVHAGTPSSVAVPALSAIAHGSCLSAGKGPRKTGQQVSFQARVIMEDSGESTDSVYLASSVRGGGSSLTAADNPSSGRQTLLRQRHSSAPESSCNEPDVTSSM